MIGNKVSEAPVEAKDSLHDEVRFRSPKKTLLSLRSVLLESILIAEHCQSHVMAILQTVN